MSLFLRLCIWSYVAFVRVAGLSCSIRTVDREIRLSLPSREVGTRRKLNEKKKKKKATNRNLYDIFFFFFERISISFGTWQRSIRRKDFCENCDYEDVFKKIFSRWIINLVEERVLVSRVKFFYLANFASRIHDGSILRLRDFSYIWNFTGAGRIFFIRVFVKWVHLPG